MASNLVAVAALLATLVSPGSDWHDHAAAERAQAQPPSSEARRSEDSGTLKRAAEGHLKFLYAVYFAVKGCTEASIELAKDEYRPSVTVDQVRATVIRAEAASRKAGLDIDTAWQQASPVGQITAESLKSDTPINLDRCQRTGRYFKNIVSELEFALTELGRQD